MQFYSFEIVIEKEPEDEGSDLSKKPKFDETTVFQFYSKSADKPLPGKGAGETIEPRNIKKFADLASMPGWRKVLSNFYMGPFKLDNRTWNSVEHYYHANKFKKGHPKFYQEFTVESGTDISKDPAFAKAAGGKTGKFKKKDWKRPKEIVIDEKTGETRPLYAIIFITEDLASKIPTLLNDIQQHIYDKALKYRNSHIHTVDTYEEFREVLEKEGGFVLAHWDGTTETELKIKEETKATLRIIPVDTPREEGKCIVTGKPSQRRVLFAKAY